MRFHLLLFSPGRSDETVVLHTVCTTQSWHHVGWGAMPALRRFVQFRGIRLLPTMEYSGTIVFLPR
jgi:hypothetical protein